MSENEEETNSRKPESDEAADPLDPTKVDPRRAFEMGAETPDANASPSHWSPPEPEVLDPLFPDYDIAELLGRGGMGAVYRGVQKSLDRPVAIKVLPPEMAEADPSFAARFEREAKSMARLDHPNIVHVYDFGRTEAGHWFIVMEFVDGMDFHQLIRSGSLDQTGALNAVSQICDALEYAHEQGYVHRDIKPANIFINQKGILKVGDFGLAKMIEGDSADTTVRDQPVLTQTGFSMGTPDYCAPEQIEGGPIDHRADIYSLGVMFYEMLTRELPRGNFPPPSKKVTVDVRIDDVVLRAMESEPEMRYSTAGEMRTEVEEVRTGETAPAAVIEESRPEAAPSESKADRSVAKTLIVLAGLVGILVFFSVAVGLGFLILKPPKTVNEPRGESPEPLITGHSETGIGTSDPSATFPLSPPPVPKRSTIECRLVVVPIDSENPAPPGRNAHLIEEADHTDIVDFAVRGDIALLHSGGQVSGWKNNSRSGIENWDPFPNQSSFTSVSFHGGLHATTDAGQLLTLHGITPSDQIIVKIAGRESMPVRCALKSDGTILVLDGQGRMELNGNAKALQERPEWSTLTDVVDIASSRDSGHRFSFLHRDGNTTIFDLNLNAGSLSIEQVSGPDNVVKLGIGAQTFIRADGTVVGVEQAKPIGSHMDAWRGQIDEIKILSGGLVAATLDDGSWRFFHSHKTGGRIEPLEKALMGATHVEFSAYSAKKDHLFALVPADTVSRSGYWRIEDLIEDRRRIRERLTGTAESTEHPPQNRYDLPAFHGELRPIPGTAGWRTEEPGKLVKIELRPDDPTPELPGFSETPEGLTDIISIYELQSGSAMMAIRSDGSVVSWGADCPGLKEMPRDLTDVVAIDFTGDAGIALHRDGTVTAWPVFKSSRMRELAKAKLQKVVSICMASPGLILLATEDGKLHAFGGKQEVQSIPELHDVRAVVSGEFRQILALHKDGTLSGFAFGETGSTQEYLLNFPKELPPVRSITGGPAVLLENGKVIGWEKESPYFSFVFARDAVGFWSNKMEIWARLPDLKWKAMGSTVPHSKFSPEAMRGIEMMTRIGSRAIGIRPLKP